MMLLMDQKCFQDHREKKDVLFLLSVNTQGHLYSFIFLLYFFVKWSSTQPQTSAVLYFPAPMEAM